MRAPSFAPRACVFNQSHELSAAGWHVDEAELDIVHIMTYMRQRLNNSSVFLVEFFRFVDRQQGLQSQALVTSSCVHSCMSCASEFPRCDVAPVGLATAKRMRASNIHLRVDTHHLSK